MSLTVTPAPLYSTFGSYQWQEWFRQVRDKLIQISSGTYTPTSGSQTNITSYTLSEAKYTKIDNIVSVSGLVTIDPTAAGAISLTITLPISSNLTNNYDLCGVASLGDVGGHSASIVADTTNDVATLNSVVTDTSSRVWAYSFSYKVI